MNNPYAKLGGGALDQELFKRRSQDITKDQDLSESPAITQLSRPVTTLPIPLKEKRKQISSYLNTSQLKIYKRLYVLLNENVDGDTEIEKSDIVALGIELLALIANIQVPKYSNTQELRTSILDKVSKYLGTQVPKS